MPSIISRGAGSARAFGMGGCIQAGGATLTFVTSVTSVTASITIPASSAANDIAILFDVAGDYPTAPSDVAPAGWTLIGTSLTALGAASNTRSSVRYKVIAGGEPGTSVTGMSGSGYMDKFMLVFRKSAGTWQTPAGNSQQSTTGNPTLQTVSGGTAPLIILAEYILTPGFAAIDPRTFSPAADAEVTAGG